MARFTQLNLQPIEAAIQSGDLGTARKKLEALASERPSRDGRRQLAILAYEAGLPLVTLKLLGNLVYGSTETVSSATASEIALYAGALIQVGAGNEALTLLTKVSANDTPASVYYKALALMGRWEHDKSLPLLRRYCQNRSLDPKARLTGKIKLAACLVQQRQHHRASPLLKELMSQVGEVALPSLFSEVVELVVQCFLLQHRWKEAAVCLQAAAKSSFASSSLLKTLEKWAAMTTLLREGPTEAALASVEKLGGAIEGEGKRAVDRVLALQTKDASLLLKLYFGTPFENYRRRLLHDFRKPIELPKTFTWFPLAETDTKLLDLSSGVYIDAKKEKEVKLGRVHLPLLAGLASDFYRPFQAAALYHRAFPLKRFNPYSSPHRVDQMILRLNGFLERHEIPLKVVERTSGYQFQATAALGIRVERGSLGAQRSASALSPLEKTFGAKLFSLSDAATAAKLNTRTAQRLLSGGIESGLLERTGNARATRYRFKAR